MLLMFRGSLTQVLAYLECRAVQLHCKPLSEPTIYTATFRNLSRRRPRCVDRHTVGQISPSRQSFGCCSRLLCVMLRNPKTAATVLKAVLQPRLFCASSNLRPSPYGC